MRPELPGSELDGVFLLHTMNDSFAVHKHLTEREPRTAVLIGAGYIGLEMADALTQRGLEVTLLSRTETVLPTVDPALGVLVGDELRRHGVRVLTGLSATRIEQQSGDSTSPRLLVTDSAGTQHPADMVILAVGVRPASDLARRAGAELGVRGAIAVTHRMQTSLPDVLAAGDCVETYHRLLDQPVYISLGTIAHKQGRIAGENALGGDREFAGALGTQSLKVFDLAIARTGLMDHEARNGGFDPLTVPMEANDHKAYYPGAVTLHIRMTGDRQTGRLLGAQILGHRKAEISKRIDIVAAALFRMRASSSSTTWTSAIRHHSAVRGTRCRWLPRLGPPARRLPAIGDSIKGRGATRQRRGLRLIEPNGEDARRRCAWTGVRQRWGGTSKTRPIKPPTAMSHEKVRKALNAVMKESNRNAYGAPIWSDGCRELAGCQG